MYEYAQEQRLRLRECNQRLKDIEKWEDNDSSTESAGGARLKGLTSH